MIYASVASFFKLYYQRYLFSSVVLGLSVAFALKKRQQYLSHRKSLEPKENKPKDCYGLGEKDARRKVAVDRVFFQRLKTLLKIVLPGVRSKEFLLLALHTMFLVSRTMVSIYVAQLDGSIVKSIVDRKSTRFIILMMKWLLIAVPATYINSMIHYLENKLSIAFRTRLVQHVYDLYMRAENYYKVGNLDTRLPNPDQCLTEDVAVFCSDLAHLYSHLSKPCLDIVLMTLQLGYLAQKRGANFFQTTVPGILAVGVISCTGFALKLATPPFGKLVAEQARRYGNLRAAHARVITHAEEIAFYGGHAIEKNTLWSAYCSLVKHMNFIFKKKIGYTMLEQFLMRYVWGACGMVMIAIPSFRGYTNAAATTTTPAITAGAKEAAAGKETISLSAAFNADIHDEEGDTVSNRTQDFVTARGLLISAADAIERMMSSWKEITELAGRTARISDMIGVFEELESGKFNKGPSQAEPAKTISLSENEDNDTVIVDHAPVKIAGQGSSNKLNAQMRDAILNGKGVVYDNSPYIELQNVPIVTPNGDILIAEPGLSLTIHPGMHLLITGPNGCGKSSLFRMIGGLWPVKGGVLRKPSKGDMFYIPQRPYLTVGTLRDQFIYPDTEEDMIRKGFTDSYIMELCEVVHLRKVVERVGGLDSQDDWRDVLSGGEKQRVAMARAFYHKPHFAILDECTSAVSIDVEGRMYTYAKDLGITLITVTHRPSLWKYHTHLLQFDGQGGYKFEPLNIDTRLSLAEEKAKIEQQLAGLPELTSRLTELCELLGEDSIYKNSDAENAQSSVSTSD